MADNKNWDMDMDIAGPTQSTYATYIYEQNVRTYKEKLMSVRDNMFIPADEIVGYIDATTIKASSITADKIQPSTIASNMATNITAGGPWSHSGTNTIWYDSPPTTGTVVVNPSISRYDSTNLGGSTISSISDKIDIDPWGRSTNYETDRGYQKLKEDYIKYLANLEAKRPFASMPLDHKIDSDIFTKNLKLNPAPAPAPIEPAKPALPAQLELF